jgi:hypothetical protein
MLWQDQEPIDAMPRLTPYDIGNYLFEARLDPRLEGDPQPELHTASLQVEVSETPPEEEMLFTFLLPTIQSLSAFAPPAGMGKLAWTVSSHIHEGNYGEAARELGKEYLLSPLNDRITEKVTQKLAPWGEALVETLKERLPSATLTRIEDFVGRQAEALDQQWVEEAMEILDLDLIGNTVGAMTEAVEEQAAETFGYDAPPQTSFWRRLLTVNEAWAAKPAPGLYDAARFYQQFLRGTDRYGVLIVSRRGMTGLTATAADGRPIQLREYAASNFTSPCKATGRLRS